MQELAFKPEYLLTEGDLPRNPTPGTLFYIEEGPMIILARRDGSLLKFSGGGGDPNDLGEYTSLNALKITHPTAEAGNFAKVKNATENLHCVWDVVLNDWAASAEGKADVNSVNNKRPDANGNIMLGAADLDMLSEDQLRELLREIGADIRKVAEKSEQASEKDKPGGYAGLGETGKVSPDVLPPASENAPGGVALAKNDDVDAEEDDTKAMTPLKSVRMVERKVRKLVSSDVYIDTGLTVLKAYDNDPTFDLAGPLSMVEGKIAVDDKVKIAGKVAKITAIEEQSDAPEGEEPVVYVTLDKAVLSAADAGAGIGKAEAMVPEVPETKAATLLDLRVGTEMSFVEAKNLNAYLASLLKPQIFNEPGTYEVVVPEGVTELRVKRGAAAGGGGTGGGRSAAGGDETYSGPGAGAGDSVVDFVIPVKPGDVVTMVVGTGGKGGAAGTAAARGKNGTNGGNTTISINGVIKLLLVGGKASQWGDWTCGGYAGGVNAQSGEVGLRAYQGGDGGDNLVGIGGPGGYGISSSPNIKNGSRGVNGGGGGGGGGNGANNPLIGDGGDGGDGILEIVWEVAA